MAHGRNRHRTALAVTALLGAATLPASAHEDVENPAVQARMDAMKEIAAEIKALTGMSRGETAFDAGAVSARMTAIATTADRVPALFEAPETDPASEAKPAIWTSFPEFTRRAGAMSAAARAGAGAADPAALQAALGGLAETCKACHATYKD